MSQAIAETGNAELAPGTAHEIEPKQELETPEEAQVAENEVPSEETETAGSEDSTDSAPPPDPFAELDDDALLKHERVAALLEDRASRKAEAERQRGEAQTAQRIRAQVEQYVQQGNLTRDLNSKVQEVIARIRPKLEAGETIDSSELVVPQQELSALSNALYSYVNNYNASQWESVMESLSPLGQLPEAVREKVDRASIAMQSGRANVGDYMKSRMEAAIEAEIAKREPDMRKRWAAEQSKAAKKEAEIEKQRAADAARNGGNSPSAGKGNGSAPRTIDDMFSDPNRTLKGLKDAFKSETGLDFDRL